MTPTYSQAQFEACPPPAELAPLLMMRRSLDHAFRRRRQADEVAELARGNPGDARLAATAAHLQREADVALDLAAGAIIAALSREAGPPGPIDVLGYKDDPSVLRVEAGDPPRLRVLSPGEAGYPGPSAAFDLPGAEMEACRRSARATIGSGPLLDRTLAMIDPGEEPNTTPVGHWLGKGLSVGWYVSSLASTAEIKLSIEAKEAASEAARAARVEASRVAERARRRRGRGSRRRRR